MGKAPKWGVNNYVKRTRRKRPGRHAKSYSKRIPHKKKYRGQGKWKEQQKLKIEKKQLILLMI